MMPPMQPTPVEDPTGGAFQKMADQASQALAGMYKLVHKQAPDSPESEALVTLQKAVAEIESRFESGSMSAGPETDAELALAEEDSGEPLDPAAQEDPALAAEQDPSLDPTQEVPAPEPTGRPMFDAAAELHTDTQNDARRKRAAY